MRLTLVLVIAIVVGVGTLLESRRSPEPTRHGDPLPPPIRLDAMARAAIRDAGHPCGGLVSSALMSDGSVRATCTNGETYRVSLRGGTLVAMRCSAAARLGITGC